MSRYDEENNYDEEVHEDSLTWLENFMGKGKVNKIRFIVGMGFVGMIILTYAVVQLLILLIKLEVI